MSDEAIPRLTTWLPYTEDVTGNTSRERARTGNGDHVSGGSGDGHAELRAHGYEVKL